MHLKILNLTLNKQLKSSLENQVGNYNVNIFDGFRTSSSKVFLKPIKNIQI